jgi:hypothetical protein
MSGGGRRAKLGPAPAPTPTPQSSEEESIQAGEAERRKRRANKGRRSTILTEVSTEKEPILGNTGQ